MEWFEPLIIIAVVTFVVTIFTIHFYRKKKGKSGCSCGCCSTKSSIGKCTCGCCSIKEDNK